MGNLPLLILDLTCQCNHQQNYCCLQLLFLYVARIFIIVFRFIVLSFYEHPGKKYMDIASSFSRLKTKEFSWEIWDPFSLTSLKMPPIPEAIIFAIFWNGI
jgi:hypothetical protein